MLNDWDTWEPSDTLILWGAIIAIALVLLCCGCCVGDILEAIRPGPPLGDF